MKCKKCGEEISGMVSFCKFCGTDVNEMNEKSNKESFKPFVYSEGNVNCASKENNVKKIITKEDKALLFAPFLFSSEKIKRKSEILESLSISDRSSVESLYNLRTIGMALGLIETLLIIGFVAIISVMIDGQWWRW